MSGIVALWPPNQPGPVSADAFLRVPFGLRSWPRAPWIPSTRDLARIAADVAPAAGEDGPWAVLGGWAAVRARGPLAQEARRVAMAAGAFACPPDAARSPLRAWLADRPAPPAAWCAGALAVSRSPWWPWRVRAAAAGGWWLDPIGPMPAALVPEEPVALDGIGSVCGAVREGSVVALRLVRGTSGVVAVLPLVLPCDDPAVLRGALAAAHAEAGDHRALACALSAAGHRFAGWAHRAVAP